MLLGGLWHGASWNFVLWGGLNGLGLVVYKGWRRISPWEKGRQWWKRALGVFLTFHFITFTRIWFRSGSHVSWEGLDRPHDIWAEWFTANEMIGRLSSAFWTSPFMEIATGYAPVICLMGFGVRNSFDSRTIKEEVPKWLCTCPAPCSIGRFTCCTRLGLRRISFRSSAFHLLSILKRNRVNRLARLIGMRCTIFVKYRM